MHIFKLFCRENSTQDEKVHFIKGNELRVTQIELLSLYIFTSLLLVTLKFAKSFPYLTGMLSVRYNTMVVSNNYTPKILV